MPKSEKQRRAACTALNGKKPNGAAKEMKRNISEKDLEKFCKGKIEENTVMDNNILTEAQKKELSKIIDTLVEERVQEKQAQFVKKYTKFIVESATSKVVEKMRSGLILQVEERINEVKNKAKKACTSVLAEAASKVQKTKNIHKTLVEEFKVTAPKLIKDLAKKEALRLSEEARGAIEENDRLNAAFKNFTEGLSRAGYIINEDLDNAIEKERTEKRMLRTKLVEAKRDLKLAQLTEGMLPGQKKKVKNLLEDCVTEKQVEDRFLTSKAKVLSEDRHVETENINDLREREDKQNKTFSEEETFDSFLSTAKEFMQKN